MIDLETKKQYQDNGYIEFKPYQILNELQINKLKKFFNTRFLKFSDAHNYKSFNISYAQEEFDNNYVKYRGWSKNQILLRYQKYENENILIGKRGVLNVINIDDPIVKIIENNEILNLAKNLLNEDEIVFLNGSFAVSYPGNLGEGKRCHSDITAFNNNKKIEEIMKKNKHVCNLMIYLDDVDFDNAPMRILPKSHKQYSFFNSKIAKSLKIDEKKSHVPQAFVVFDEIIESQNFKYLTGKKGTVIGMNSFCIHAATENISEHKTRSVIILNYGPKNFGLFKRGMNHVKKNKFYIYLSKKDLFEYKTIDYKKIKTKLNFIKNFFKSFIQKIIKLYFLRSFAGKIKLNLIKFYYKSKKKKLP